MRGKEQSRRDFGPKWAKIELFREKQASRKPYKASENLKSRDTALFAILYYRGSGELTEAFCLCFKVKIGLKMAKISILGPFLVFLNYSG